MLALGADPNFTNENGHNGIHNGGCPEIMCDLIEHGTDPNAYSKSGDTPLHTAMEDLDPYMIRFLLCHPAVRQLLSQNEIHESPVQELRDCTPSRRTIAKTLLCLALNPITPAVYLPSERSRIYQFSGYSSPEAQYLDIYNAVETIYYEMFPLPVQPQEYVRPSSSIVELACTIGQPGLLAILLFRGEAPPEDALMLLQKIRLLPYPKDVEDPTDDDACFDPVEDELVLSVFDPVYVQEKLAITLSNSFAPWTCNGHLTGFPDDFRVHQASIFLCKTILNASKFAPLLPYLPFEMWITIASFTPRRFFKRDDKYIEPRRLLRAVEYMCKKRFC